MWLELLTNKWVLGGLASVAGIGLARKFGSSGGGSSDSVPNVVGMPPISYGAGDAFDGYLGSIFDNALPAGTPETRTTGTTAQPKNAFRKWLADHNMAAPLNETDRQNKRKTYRQSMVNDYLTGHGMVRSESTVKKAWRMMTKEFMGEEKFNAMNPDQKRSAIEEFKSKTIFKEGVHAPSNPLAAFEEGLAQRIAGGIPGQSRAFKPKQYTTLNPMSIMLPHLNSNDYMLRIMDDTALDQMFAKQMKAINQNQKTRINRFPDNVGQIRAESLLQSLGTNLQLGDREGPYEITYSYQLPGHEEQLFRFAGVMPSKPAAAATPPAAVPMKPKGNTQSEWYNYLISKGFGKHNKDIVTQAARIHELQGDLIGTVAY